MVYRASSDSHSSHTLVFDRGDVNETNVITMAEFRNADSAAVDNPSLQNAPPILTSPYISVEPHGVFSGASGKAKISINFDPGLVESGTSMRFAGPSNAYVFTAVDTQIIDGQAVAETDEGGIFVVGSNVNYDLVIGLSVAGVVLLIVILMVVGSVIYFVVRPEKWKSAKGTVKKTQMKFKRSFAKQV